MRPELAHRIASEQGVNPLVYWIARIVLRPIAAIFFRLRGIGADHVPAHGPVLIAANHRSFSDPFFIGLCLRRKLHFMAKVELFDARWKAHLLLALGAFPVRRGEADEQAIATARSILERGGAVGIFPEGTRVRPGPLGRPHRGVGRLALETGATVVPAAIVGTEHIRRGWRIRPRKVRVRFGRPLAYPRPVDGKVGAGAARELTARVWSSVELGWEWLGGVAPVRTAAVVGAGSWGTALAVLLARAGATVTLATRTPEQAAELRVARENEGRLPGIRLNELVHPVAVERASLDRAELVCIAVPSRSLPAAIATLEGRLRPDATVLVATKGLVAPHGELPVDYARGRLGVAAVAYLAGPAHAREAVTSGSAGLVVACDDAERRARVARLLDGAGTHVEQTDDVVGAQLAACAKNAAALAAAVALEEGPNSAGLAAGGVFSECRALAAANGAAAGSFAGLAGTGDLVATVLAPGSRNRRAGELIARGGTLQGVEEELGQVAEALDLVPLLDEAMQRARIRAPETRRLAQLLSERSEPVPEDGERAERRRAPVAAHV